MKILIAAAVASILFVSGRSEADEAPVLSADASCLFGITGTYPQFTQPGEFERIDWLRGEMKLLESTKLMTNKGKLLATIADYIKFGFDYTDVCASDLATYISTKVLVGNPLPFSPLLFSAVSAAGSLPDHRGIYEMKANILIPLYRAPASRFSAWTNDARSGGVSIVPNLENLHTSIASQFVHSNLLLNSASYRSLLQDTLALTKEYRARVVIAPDLKNLASFHVSSWEGADKNIGKQLMLGWLNEVKPILAGQLSSISPFETVIADLDILASYAKAYGLEAEVRALLIDVAKIYEANKDPMPIAVYRAAKTAVITLDTSSVRGN